MGAVDKGVDNLESADSTCKMLKAAGERPIARYDRERYSLDYCVSTHYLSGSLLAVEQLPPMGFESQNSTTA